MIHLTSQQLSSYMDGELNEASTELVRRHMGACEACTLKFAQLEVQEDLLSKALVHDPGEPFFERFVEAVGKQIPAGKGFKSTVVRPAASGSSPAPPSRSAASRPAVPLEAVRDEEPDLALSGDDEAGMMGGDDSPSLPDETPRREIEREPAFSEASARAVESAPRGGSAARTGPAPRALGDSPSRVKAPPAAPPRPKPFRPRVRRPAPSVPWYVALILAAISASVGFVVSRSQPVSAWLDSKAKPGTPAPAQEPPAVEPPAATPPPPEETTPAPAKTSSSGAKPAGAPARQSETAAKVIDESPAVDDEAMDPELTSANGTPNGPDVPELKPQEATWFLASDVATARPAKKDAFSSLKPAALALVRSAQKSVSAADSDPSAAGYESAAADWEHAIPELRGWQQSQGRFELASARYRAWEMDPTPARADAATVAIRAYMTSASQGPARDQARAWLARLQH